MRVRGLRSCGFLNRAPQLGERRARTGVRRRPSRHSSALATWNALWTRVRCSSANLFAWRLSSRCLAKPRTTTGLTAVLRPVRAMGRASRGTSWFVRGWKEHSFNSSRSRRCRSSAMRASRSRFPLGVGLLDAGRPVRVDRRLEGALLLKLQRGLGRGLLPFLERRVREVRRRDVGHPPRAFRQRGREGELRVPLFPRCLLPLFQPRRHPYKASRRACLHFPCRPLL